MSLMFSQSLHMFYETGGHLVTMGEIGVHVKNYLENQKGRKNLGYIG
jgi:hypothetical protein